MKRFVMLAAILALASSGAYAASGGAPYKLDAKGKCHASDGKFAKQTLCSTPAPVSTAAKHCKDPKTKKFAKCTAPGAVPA
jgi:hypothetical protein